MPSTVSFFKANITVSNDKCDFWCLKLLVKDKDKSVQCPAISISYDFKDFYYFWAL